MGHKAHPIGLRLGIHRKWKSNWFFESKNYTQLLHINLNIEKFFKGYLYFYGIKSLLLNCQIIKLSSNQLFIFIFFYRFRKKKLKFKKYKRNFFKWRDRLEKYFFKKKAENLILNSTNKHDNNLKKFNSIYKKYSYNLYQSFFKNYFLINLKFNLKKQYNFLLNTFYILNKYRILIKKNINISKIVFKKIIYKLKLILKIILNLKKFLYTNNIKTLSYKQFLMNKHLFNIKLLKTFIFKNNALKIIYFIYFKKLLNKTNLKLKKLKYNAKKKDILKKFWEKNSSFSNKKILKKKKKFLFKQNFFASITNIKQFLSKLTNSKINLIFINTLSFTKFFYLLAENKNKKRERFNVFQLQRFMVNKYKYNAIFIKDFIYLTFIAVLFKNTNCIVKFIAEQFKRLPKNRKQLKLLRFIQQSLKILCGQRKEITGFKLLIKGRLNRRTRTRKWNLQKGNLPLQTHITRVEYGYSEGFTRSGLLGIKLWFFYKKSFSKILKKKLLQYFFYSKYKFFIKKSVIKRKKINVKTKSKKI